MTIGRKYFDYSTQIVLKSRPVNKSHLSPMKIKITASLLIVIGLFCAHVRAEEFKGQFETTLVAGVEDLEWVIFKFDSGERFAKIAGAGEGAHFAAAKLLDPRTEQYSLRS